jgi:hypothetical protein
VCCACGAKVIRLCASQAHERWSGVRPAATAVQQRTGSSSDMDDSVDVGTVNERGEKGFRRGAHHGVDGEAKHARGRTLTPGESQSRQACLTTTEQTKATQGN